jgi:hypothetical protein
MKKIATQSRSFTREIKKLYPGISDETAHEAVKALYTLVLDFKLDDDEDTWSLFEAKVGELAEEDENEWAAEMVKSRSNRARPFYDKAIASGADPVQVIQAMCAISEQAACDLVNAFEAEKSDDKPSVPAQSSEEVQDPFAANEDKAENTEDREEQFA